MAHTAQSESYTHEWSSKACCNLSGRLRQLAEAAVGERSAEHGPKAGVACCLRSFDQNCTIKELMRIRAVQ